MWLLTARFSSFRVVLLGVSIKANGGVGKIFSLFLGFIRAFSHQKSTAESLFLQRRKPA
jgi:hypothetical protein